MSILLLWAHSLYSGDMPWQPRISKFYLNTYSSAYMHRKNILNDNERQAQFPLKGYLKEIMNSVHHKAILH